MPEVVVNLLLPSTSSGADLALIILRIFTGIAFIQHGIPKLKKLNVWSSMIGMPPIICAAAASTMVIGGFLLIPGLFTVPAAAGIGGTMVYAVFFLAGKGAAFAPPEPFELAKGDYFGSMGPGEPSSWEKAAIYVVIALVLVLIGPGSISLDHLWLAPLMQ
ncbi:MAG: DoxX family protein [Synechococcus sp.]|nr:DoxX family protein [Synechococcus sp.]